MFNLEQSIVEWRRQMASGGIKDSDTLAELESHLREDVERRIDAGASAEQAFREAVIQVGTAEQLRAEFGKISKPRAGFSPRIVRIGCAVMAVFTLLCEGWYVMSSDITLMERIAALIFVAAIACYIGFLPELNRLWPGVAGWGLRRDLGRAASVILLVWTCMLLLSLANPALLPSGIVLSTVCWALYVAAAATAFVLGHGTGPELLNVWTPEVWRSFDVAHAEAIRFRHNFIGTEHLLLGLLQVEGSSIPTILGRMGVDCGSVSTGIEKIVGAGGQSSAGQKIPCTPRARKAMQIAIQEAKRRRTQRASAEHLFLGLIREGSGVAALVLKELGVNLEDARKEVLRMAR